MDAIRDGDPEALSTLGFSERLGGALNQRISTAD